MVKTGPKPKPMAERFWSKVEKSETCWMWVGAKYRSGYGSLGTTYGKSPRPAHRVSWELHFGPIPDGLFVCHRCDVRACVRPDHLFLGTSRDNIQDMLSKDRGRWSVSRKQAAV